MKRHKIGLMALVLGITVAAILSWTLMVHRQPQLTPPEPLTAMLQREADRYGSGVGYEIFSWTDNEATASIYLEAENGQIPFENIHLCKTGNEWWVNHSRTRHWPVLSPSRELAIVNYEVDVRTIQSSFFEGEHECLIYLIPVAKNLSRWPAFVASVELELENLTGSYRKSYSAISWSVEGIVGSGEIAAIGVGGGPFPPYEWYFDNSITLLRMDLLQGKTYTVNIVLRNGEGTVLAENTFIHTFARPPVGEAITTLENFLRAFNDNDVEGMWNLLSADQREHMSIENFRKVVRRPGEDVLGQLTGTLELEGAALKDVKWAEATLTVEIVEHRAVLRVLSQGENVGCPPVLSWENCDLRGSGEVKLRFEGGGWKIDTPVVVHPDPARPVLALGLEVEAPAEIEVGDGAALKFEIRNKSFLPITIYHAHTPARATLYRGENLIAQFPQAIYDVLMTATLGPFGSQTYEESIPPSYSGVLHEGEELLATFSEPGIYRIVPFAEFNVWWKAEMGRVESHRLQAPPIEIEVRGAPLIYLSTFNIRLLDFFNRQMGDLSGKFQISGSSENVEVELGLGFSGQAVENLHIENLVLDTNLAFYGFWEKDEMPRLPAPLFQSITIGEGERVIPLKRTYDVSGFERPMFYVGFKINSIRASFSDGQVRVLTCGIHPLWNEEYKFPPSVVGMELEKRTEWHFYDVGTDLAIELDNWVYLQGSEIQVRVTNLTNETLAFLGDRYDIRFHKWLEEEKHWYPLPWVETQAISLPPGQSHAFSYRLEESPDHPFPPGRYRVVCHSSSAEFWIQ